MKAHFQSWVVWLTANSLFCESSIIVRKKTVVHHSIPTRFNYSLFEFDQGTVECLKIHIIVPIRIKRDFCASFSNLDLRKSKAWPLSTLIWCVIIVAICLRRMHRVYKLISTKCIRDVFIATHKYRWRIFGITSIWCTPNVSIVAHECTSSFCKLTSGKSTTSKMKQTINHCTVLFTCQLFNKSYHRGATKCFYYFK